MKNSTSRILTLLMILLALAVSLPLVSFSRFVRADRERSESGQRAGKPDARSAAKESPPEDWFISQRVTHGGIPIGAPERAAAQAAALAQAAEQSNRPLAVARWRFVGPTNIGGRVVDIAVDPVAVDTIYIAAATGGAWKSTDRGARFISIWPAANPQSMGALLITSTGTLFAGTGEANPGGGSITYGGGGIFRSVDGGASWQRVGLTNTAAIGRLVIDPTNPQRIFAAVTGDLYNPGGQRGVYQSTDGGSTWRRVLAGDNNTTGAVDLAIDPTNPNRVFAAMWDHLREPDLRTYGGLGSGVYRSIDGGTTWQRLTNGLPAPSAAIGRIGIAVAPSNPQRVFAIVIQTGGLFQGLYRSDNAGESWTQLPNSSTLSGAQSTYGWWFGRIWVDPSDQNHVFGAGVYLCESTDGGSSFTGQFSPHADDHAMTWDVKVPGRVYLGNDGGTYRSDVNGSHDQWTSAVSQPFTQFYSVDVSEQDSTRVVGGAQDNGVNRSYGATGWNSYIGGDGEEALIDPADQNNVYGCSQYGECSRSTNGGTTSSDFTGATVSSRRNWFSPLQFDPSNSAVLYYAGNQVNRSVDHAVHWSVISPDLTGGPGRDPNYPFGTVTTVAAAKSDSNRLFTGTDDGRLWFTKNLGLNWTRVIDPDLPGTWVTRVAVDPTNSSVAYATFSGFRSGTQLPYVLKTIDGGATWTSIVGNLPQAPVSDIVLIGSSLYVATDVGVFNSDNGGTTWSTVGSKLPNVPVTDLEYVANSNSLYAATFGRGIFSLVLPP
jgi:Sortilin, neurotensin receptor 3,